MQAPNFIFPRIFVTIFLGLMWVLFLRNAFDGERIFSLYEDNEFLLGPLFSSISKIYQSGDMPIRMDSILGGFPLYNFTQVTPYYPFYGFFLDIYNGFIPTLKTLHNLIVLHLFLMLLNMYYLLRKIGASICAGIMGAVLFTFGADMYAYTHWVNIIVPYSWLPLYIAGVFGIVEGSKVRINYLIILFSMCMIVTASPSQPLIQAVLITAFILLGYVIYNAKLISPLFIAVPIIRMIAIAIICLLVCAPVIMPASFEANRMIRWIGNFPAIFLNERIPFDAFVYYKLPIEDFWRLFFYEPRGIVGNAYIGFFAVPLIALAFLHGFTWLPVTLLVVATYSLVSAFGDDLGLAYINHQIPLLNKIREPSRNLALFHLGVVMLSTLGITNLFRAIKEKNSIGSRGELLLASSFVIVVFAYVYGFFRFYNGSNIDNVFGDFKYTLQASDTIRFFACISLIIFTLAVFRFQSKLFCKLIVYAWPIAIITGLFTAVSWQPPLKISDSLYVRNNLTTLEMAIIDIRERDKSSDFRVLFDGDIDKGQAAMLAAYHGVRSFSYYINPAPIRQAVEFEWHGYTPFYAYQGAKYLICKKCDINKYPRFKLMSNHGEYQIFVDDNAYPHIYAADIVGNYSNSKDFVSIVKSEIQLATRRAYIEGASLPYVPDSRGDSQSCIIQSFHESSTRYEILASCDPGVAIVLNEYNDGNWVGRINGRLTEIFRINGSQNGIISSGGTQFITFEYYPVIFFNSFLFSIIGIFCFSLLWLIELRYNFGKSKDILHPKGLVTF